MDAPRELTLTLPPDLAQAVRAEMAEGDYADEMEVIREALSALADDRLSHDSDFAITVRERYAAWRAAPGSTITTNDIRAEFAAGQDDRL